MKFVVSARKATSTTRRITNANLSQLVASIKIAFVFHALLPLVMINSLSSASFPAARTTTQLDVTIALPPSL